MFKSITSRYTLNQIRNILLVVIFPQHTWTIYMVFRDLAWIANSNSVGDAIGVFGYAMLFALGESILLFIPLLLFALLLPRKWTAAMPGSGYNLTTPVTLKIRRGLTDSNR